MPHRTAEIVLGIVLAGSLFGYGGASARQISPDVKSPEPKSIGGVARGRNAYLARCEICHFSDSTARKIGPGMKELYKRGKFSDGGKVNDASIERWIVKGGTDMPPAQPALNPTQLRDLIAYLKTL